MASASGKIHIRVELQFCPPGREGGWRSCIFVWTRSWGVTKASVQPCRNTPLSRSCKPSFQHMYDTNKEFYLPWQGAVRTFHTNSPCFFICLFTECLCWQTFGSRAWVSCEASQPCQHHSSALLSTVLSATARTPGKPKAPLSRGAADGAKGFWLLGVPHNKQQQQFHICCIEAGRSCLCLYKEKENSVSKIQCNECTFVEEFLI